MTFFVLDGMKISISDIELGDRFKDDDGVLCEIINFIGSQTAVCRRVTGKVPGGADREIPLGPALLAKVRLYLMQSETKPNPAHTA